MKKGIVLLAVASGLTFLASHAVAGNRPGAVTFTPGIGYDFFASKRNIRNTAVIPELALAYNFDEHWGLEGAWGTFGTTYHGGVAANQSVKGDLYTLAGLYHLNQLNYHIVEPYVSAGLGVLYLNPNRSNANNLANLNAALGTQVFFSDSIAFRSEVRDLYTMSGGVNDVMLNFGVSFLIGGNTPVAEPSPYKQLNDSAVSSS
jgi:hypothetical protein